MAMKTKRAFSRHLITRIYRPVFDIVDFGSPKLRGVYSLIVKSSAVLVSGFQKKRANQWTCLSAADTGHSITVHTSQ